MNHEIKPADPTLAFQEDDIGSDADKAAIGTNVTNLPVPATGTGMRKSTKKLVTTLTLSSRTCKWPIGDPAKSGFHYCGLPPQSGRPYCDTHDSMSYQATPRKKASPAFR